MPSTSLRPDAPTFVPFTNNSAQLDTGPNPPAEEVPPLQHDRRRRRRNRNHQFSRIDDPSTSTSNDSRNSNRRQSRQRGNRSRRISKRKEQLQGSADSRNERVEGKGHHSVDIGDDSISRSFDEFPAIATGSVRPVGTLHQSEPSPWVLAAKSNQNADVDDVTADSSDYTSLSSARLTPLTLLSRNSTLSTNQSLSEPAESLTEVDTFSAETALEQTQRRRVDITRLRDRWWEAMKNRPPPEEAPEEDTESLDKDTSDGTVSDEGLVEVSENSAWASVHAIESSSVGVDVPLHEAIRRDDVESVRRHLQTLPFKKGDEDDTLRDCVSPLQLAVQLNKPQILRMLLRATRHGILDGVDERKPAIPLVVMAAKLGLEECLQAIVVSCGPSVLLMRDTEGNTAVHIACRDSALGSMLPLMLRTCGNMLYRIISARNDRGETPLHVACRHERVDLVEAILDSGSFSLLSKLLLVQDLNHHTPLLAAISCGSTDIVMSLFMWRGNNHMLTPVTDSASPCPLICAVESKNIDMVVLLLEFNDPSRSGYNLTRALQHAIRMRETEQDESLVDLIRVLVQAGANPCSLDTPSERSTLALASVHEDVDALRGMLDSYDGFLETTRSERRRDPVLSRQPESFFAGMESRENAERSTAFRDALVTSLFRSWHADFDALASLQCCLELYKAGAKLGSAGFTRLVASIKSNAPMPVVAVQCPSSNITSNVYEASNKRPLWPWSNPGDKRPLVEHWTRLMLTLSWMKDVPSSSRCSWMSSHTAACPKGYPAHDVVLVTDDGAKFEAHSAALAGSGKLSAAIRFATMSQLEGDDSTACEVTVNLSRQLCCWMLQHLYHGSILSLPSDPAEACQGLLDMLHAAQEFLCLSLLRECEMRLLSNHDSCGRCYCWYCNGGGNSGYSSKQNSESERQYSYRVMGPSQLLASPNLALDVLALVEEVGASVQDNQFCIVQANCGGESFGNPLWVDLSKHQCVALPLLHALRHEALRVVLLHFESVKAKFAFEMDEEGDDDLGWPMQARVLQGCLHDLASLLESSPEISSTMTLANNKVGEQEKKAVAVSSF